MIRFYPDRSVREWQSYTTDSTSIRATVGCNPINDQSCDVIYSDENIKKYLQNFSNK